MKFFVWLPSQTGPQPQIWHGDEPKNGEGKPKYQPLFKIKLDDNDNSTLAQLILKYPAS